MQIRVFRSLIPCCVLLSVACGGGNPEPQAPDESTEMTAPQAATEEPEAAEPVSESSEPLPQSDESNPKNVLIRAGTAFLLNHRESDIGKQAEETCAKKSGDDVAKQANCLSAAINKMDREGFLFEEDEEGKWTYVRFGIVKGVKVEFNRVEIEVGEPSGQKITLKTVGKDKAARKKGTVPSELQFEVPSEYTILLHDPSRGKLVFEPKMGLFNE